RPSASATGRESSARSFARSQPRTWPSSRSASSSGEAMPAARRRIVASCRSCLTVGAAREDTAVVRLADGRFLELLGLVVGDERVHDLVQVAVQHVLQAVQREADAVVRDARLLEVVGADLLGAIAGAHLAPAVARDRLLLLREGDLVEPGPQDLQGLLAVLDLA